jgi:menaquinone-9 beta-reductase
MHPWSSNDTKPNSTADFFDAIVVGGGPAGSGFALALAAQKKRVIVVEKDSIPSSKVCGGVLSARCLLAVEQLGLKSVLDAIPFQELEFLSVELHTGESLQVPFPSTGARTRVVNRAAMDEAFWNAAREGGAVVRDHTVARKITFLESHQWQVEVRNSEDQVLRSSLLVGADGRNSFVARQLGLPVSFKARSFCVQYCLRKHEFSPSGVHFFLFPGGYCGLSVDGTGIAHLDVLSLIGGENEVQLRERLYAQRSSFVERLERAEFIQERPVTRSPISSGRRPPTKQPQAILLGDAQAWVEPFTGEGISLALESAYRAGQWVCKKISVSAPMASRTNVWVESAIQKPWFARGLIRLLNRAPFLAKWMAREVLHPSARK